MKKLLYVLSLFTLGFFLNGQKVFTQNPPNPEIELIQPSEGGIEWIFGETYLISWTDNFINGVDIYLLDYTTSPATEIEIEKNVEGSTYLWTIDHAGIVYPRSKFKIRVQSKVNGSYNDVGESYFKILPYATDSFIKVEHPDVQGINIQIGSEYLISWNHNISGTFTIKLIDNNGNVNHTTSGNNIIASGVEGSTFIWNTTGWPQASLLKVFIESDDYTGLKDQSDRSFRLSHSVGSVEVLRPNKENAVWQVGNEYLISWNDTFTEPVDILLMDYSTPLNSVVVGAILAEDVLGTTWVWDTDGFAANDNYRIRVQSSLDATKFDDSNRDFKLVVHTGSITVEQPNVPNIEWIVGNEYLISWVDNVDAPLSIYLVDATWASTLIEAGVVGSTYVWEIDENTILGDYRILVTTTDGSIKDVSNNTFKLIDNFGEIDVLQPDVAGIEWVIGNEYLISWIDNVEGSVDIELIGNSPITVATDNAGNAPYADGFDDLDNGGFGFDAWDISSATVAGGVAEAIIDDPANGGINGMINPSFGIIAYGNSNDFGNTITARRNFVNQMEPEQTFSFDWGLGFYNGENGFRLYSGATELIEVSVTNSYDVNITFDGNTSTMFDESGFQVMNFAFEYTIDNQLRVYGEGRNGSEVFEQIFDISTIGSPDAIEFYSYGHNSSGFINRVNWFNNLKITKPGIVYTNIANDVIGTTYVWNTAGFSPGTYKIRVSNGSIEDFSANTFKLVLSQGGALTVNQPTTGEVWYKGYPYWVIWEDDIMEPLDVYLKNDALGFSDLLKDDFEGSMFDYMVPTGLGNSSEYYIEIVSSLDPNMDFRSDDFTITDAIMAAIYPNPSSDYFNLRLDEQMEGMFDVIVYDRFNNRMIQTQLNAATKEHRINTAQLPNGIYFMQITNGKTTITEKIVVKH